MKKNTPFTGKKVSIKFTSKFIQMHYLSIRLLAVICSQDYLIKLAFANKMNVSNIAKNGLLISTYKINHFFAEFVR